jgi:hypothetical protein
MRVAVMLVVWFAGLVVLAPDGARAIEHPFVLVFLALWGVLVHKHREDL